MSHTTLAPRTLAFKRKRLLQKRKVQEQKARIACNGRVYKA